MTAKILKNDTTGDFFKLIAGTSTGDWAKLDPASRTWIPVPPLVSDKLNRCVLFGSDPDILPATAADLATLPA